MAALQVDGNRWLGEIQACSAIIDKVMIEVEARDVTSTFTITIALMSDASVCTAAIAKQFEINIDLATPAVVLIPHQVLHLLASKRLNCLSMGSCCLGTLLLTIVHDLIQLLNRHIVGMTATLDAAPSSPKPENSRLLHLSQLQSFRFSIGLLVLLLPLVVVVLLLLRLLFAFSSLTVFVIILLLLLILLLFVLVLVLAVAVGEVGGSHDSNEVMILLS